MYQVQILPNIPSLNQGVLTSEMKEQAKTTEEVKPTKRADLSLDTKAALDKLRAINAEVIGLDPLLKERAIALLLQSEFTATTGAAVSSRTIGGAPSPSAPAGSSETDFAALVERWVPNNGNEWALLAAYHLTNARPEGVVTGQEINTVLKHHGKGVSNVTKTISRLARADPALMLQVRKDGTSRQARKSYKVTTSGITFVEERLKRTTDGGP